MFGRRKQHDSDGHKPTLSDQEIENILARTPMFEQLSGRERKSLATLGVQRSFEPGAVVVRQGDQGVGLYVVLRGAVRVTQHALDGTSHELATLGDGQIFGEMALLDERPRSATVTAIEPTVTLVIPIWDFRAAVKANGDAAMRLLTLLTQRLRDAEATNADESAGSA